MFFADHLVHSIQVDAITSVVEQNTVRVIRDGVFAGGADVLGVPEWAVPIVSQRSGYVQTVRPHLLLQTAAEQAVCLRLRHRVGEHVVAGMLVGWIWRDSRSDPAPAPETFSRVLDTGVRSDSSAPWNRTPGSESGNWWTSRARRCLRRSTIRTPRFWRSITCL
ncbi:hypothetical protein GCM10011579_033610 [Streptomyces albiflavescens]|uniref:Uncharacterized protein n=1 Tax=Streptomyces albiflavescens TaxID=1623582 RepID=A0A917Y1X1_9ACTN|nr:hypothetical protein GCM10011579_033610 [Streptomyces albiflavescens]